MIAARRNVIASARHATASMAAPLFKAVRATLTAPCVAISLEHGTRAHVRAYDMLRLPHVARHGIQVDLDQVGRSCIKGRTC